MLWESFFYTRTGELWFSLQPGAWRCLFNWGCYENGPLRAGIKDFNFIALFCTCSLPVRSMGVKFSFEKIPGAVSRSLMTGNIKYFFPVFMCCAFAVRF